MILGHLIKKFYYLYTNLTPMKNFVFMLILLSIFAACANENNNPNSSSKNKKETTAPLNPNGDSELALLMRKMEQHWKDTKKDLEAGKEITDIPDFSNLFTATPTDDQMTMDDLHGFAVSYLQQIKALEDAEDQKAAYNNIINGCITCHDNSCSGPIPRIKKLLIRDL